MDPRKIQYIEDSMRRMHSYVERNGIFSLNNSVMQQIEGTSMFPFRYRTQTHFDDVSRSVSLPPSAHICTAMK